MTKDAELTLEKVPENDQKDVQKFQGNAVLLCIVTETQSQRKCSTAEMGNIVCDDLGHNPKVS